MRDPGERQRDIVQGIENIERRVPQGKRALENELLQTWMLHYLQIIGEAVRALPEDVRSCDAGIPWAKRIGMPNILVHGYFAIDTDIVWHAVDRDIPAVKTPVMRLLRVLEGE